MKITKKQAKTENSVEKCEKKLPRPFRPEFFCENFICDPLKVISKPMGAINIWIM